MELLVKLKVTDFNSPIFTKELVQNTFIRNSSYKEHIFMDELHISGYYCIHVYDQHSI